MIQQEFMTLKKVIEAKDEIDTEIIFATINMVAGLNLETIIFRDKKSWENYFGISMNLTKSLLKANEHCRKYLKEEKRFLKEYRKKCIKDKNVNTFLATDCVGLNTEIDGFLSQIKASLDTVATTFGPLLGLSLKNWHKKSGKSGGEIISALENNLSNVDKERANVLKEVIIRNTEWITYIVTLRDQAHHKGGLKCLTDITYDFRYKKVNPQYIVHGDDGKEMVNDFMLRTMKDITRFINEVLILSILIKAPGGIGIKRNEKKEYPPFNWVVYTPQGK